MDSEIKQMCQQKITTVMLSKARVDVITTVGDLAIRAAQEATKTIPILTITDDMVGSDW
jgi:hypothetical protein